jgi:hypothetical protein
LAFQLAGASKCLKKFELFFEPYRMTSKELKQKISVYHQMFLPRKEKPLKMCIGGGGQ